MKVLLVDDEPTIRMTLGDALEDAGHSVDRQERFADGKKALSSGSYDCLITDLRLPDGSGLDLIGSAATSHPGISMLVITAHQTIETAIEATKQGADYLIKPFLNEEVLAKLAKLEEVQQLRAEVARLKTEVSGRSKHGRFVGKSQRMQDLYSAIESVGPSDATVLITGESGTGKELAAQAVHNESPRSGKKLVKLSCAALPENLLEDELFGHEKGAFTDAKERKIGRFELANGGSVFLDDIDDMSLPTQVKLLRVLQERELERIGGNKTIKLDVRVIVATKIDLSLLVRQGRFRDDLFFRLNVLELRMPPLRERLDDLAVLIDHFIQIHGGGRSFDVGEETLLAMGQYSWPGNIRELEHAVMRAIAMSGKSERLEQRFLLQKPMGMTSSSQPLLGGTLLSRPEGAEVENSSASASTDAQAQFDPHHPRPLKEVIQEAEESYIRSVLEFTKGNRTKTAALLGISRKNLWEKMKELGLK